eukprot:SAG31_NODE_1014_length_10366_cov_2.357129_3_plen_440_part_00
MVACPAETVTITTASSRTIKFEVPYPALEAHTDNTETSALDNSMVTIPCPPNSGVKFPYRMYDVGQNNFELQCQNGESAWDPTRAATAYSAACEDVNTDPNFNSYNSMYQLQGRQAATTSGSLTMEEVTRDGSMMRCARDVAQAVGNAAFDVSNGFTNLASVMDVRCDSGNPMLTGTSDGSTACALNTDSNACSSEDGQCRYTQRQLIEDESKDGFENDIQDLLWNPDGYSDQLGGAGSLTAAQFAATFGTGGNSPPMQGGGARLHRQARTIAEKFPCEKAMCTGQDDGAGAACKLDSDFAGCAVTGGTCVYVPEWTLDSTSHDGLGQTGPSSGPCETSQAEDETAAQVSNAAYTCVQRGGAAAAADIAASGNLPPSGDADRAYTLDDGSACGDGEASTNPTQCIFDQASHSGWTVNELRPNARQTNQWRYSTAPTVSA